MSSSFESAQRFFRPTDVAGLRRNQRRIQVLHALRIARNVMLACAFAALAAWAWRHTQSDARFAVRGIEISGARYTSRADLETVTQQYVGLNLFRIDIDRVQRDLGSLAWVSRVAIEKKLPDTLRITVVERVPVALVATPGGLRYADAEGVAFAPLSTSVGDPDLPLITEASGVELKRCVELIRTLKASDPEVYSRISEVRPLAPHAFAIFDRDLGAVVYADAADLSDKWRKLYAIAAAEKLGKGSIQYADLRFAGRVVLKPVHDMTRSVASVTEIAPVQITN